MKPFLEAGEFVTTHGVNGELRLYPWSDDAAFLAGFQTLYLDAAGSQPLAIEQLRAHKRVLIAKIHGIDSVEAARGLIGRTVYIARADAKLPEGRHFVQDLLGASVEDADSGQRYGTLVAVTHPGRHDVYEVRHENGGTSLLPATKPFLVSIDAEAGRITVRPIPGMLDNPTPPAQPKPKRGRPGVAARKKRGGGQAT